MIIILIQLELNTWIIFNALFCAVVSHDVYSYYRNSRGRRRLYMHQHQQPMTRAREFLLSRCIISNNSVTLTAWPLCWRPTWARSALFSLPYPSTASLRAADPPSRACRPPYFSPSHFRRTFFILFLLFYFKQNLIPPNNPSGSNSISPQKPNL